MNFACVWMLVSFKVDAKLKSEEQACAGSCVNAGHLQMQVGCQITSSFSLFKLSSYMICRHCVYTKQTLLVALE